MPYVVHVRYSRDRAFSNVQVMLDLAWPQVHV
jgi:hypothetical protein